MKKKTLQALINLGGKSPKLDHTNILQSVNTLPHSDLPDLKDNAKQYATLQLELTYGIVAPQTMTKEERKSAEQILKKIKDLKRTKPIRLADIVERISLKVNFEELQQAREFVQTLNRKDVKQMSYSLEALEKVVDQKVEQQRSQFENHTLKAAYSLIEELKKVRKIDQL